LTSSGVENEDRAVDRLSRQVAFKRLVDGDPVHVCVINEKLGLTAE
jgi:hypothetical protein